MRSETDVVAVLKEDGINNADWNDMRKYENHRTVSLDQLRKELGIDEGWIRFDAQNQRIELPLSIAEEIAEILEVPVQLVEVHPTHDRLEVGIIHLNSHR